MNTVFYEHLIYVEDVLTEIELVKMTPLERSQAKLLINELLHHRVLTLILDLLPKVHHEEFLERFFRAPHDLSHLSYLNERVSVDIHATIVTLGNQIKEEILRDVRKHHAHTKNK